MMVKVKILWIFKNPFQLMLQVNSLQLHLKKTLVQIFFLWILPNISEHHVVTASTKYPLVR